MCGRFTLTLDPAQLQDLFDFTGLPPTPVPPRYNIAPTQPVAAVALNPNGQRHLTFYVWGLIPSWAKDPSIGSRMINARAETISEKPAFRAAIKRRRCLILADGFYEWQGAGKTKTPMYITLKDRAAFGMAGLWEHWQDASGNEINSCTVITTTPNDLMKPIHDRMPAIIAPRDYDRWLAPGELPEIDRHHLLSPYPPSQMQAVAVSKKVNSPKFDSVECIEPI